MKPRILSFVVFAYILCAVSSSSSSSRFLEKICTACQHGTGRHTSLADSSTKCRRPLPPSPGFISCTENDVAVNCVGTCLGGHSFPDGSSRMILQCNVDSGRWYPRTSFPNCIEEDDINEADRQTENLDHQSQEKPPNEKLSETLARCQQPSAPADGYYNCKYDENHMKCIGKCNPGYSFVGRRQEIALECKTVRGGWYPHSSFPKCVREGGRYEEEPNRESRDVLRICHKPDAPVAGSYACTYDSTEMICRGRCNPGYLFPRGRQTMQLHCRAASGVWQPHQKFPDCSREDEDNEQNREGSQSLTLERCQRPPAPTNGHYDCEYDAIKMTCVAKCNPGHIFPGKLREMQMQCYTRRGHWYPSKFLDCSREDREGEPNEDNRQSPEEIYKETLRRCKTPQPPADGFFNCNYNSTDMICVGKCNDGYLFPGRREEMQLQCQTQSGYWHPYRNFPDCSRDYSGHREPYEDGSNNPEERYKETLERCKTPQPPANGFFNCNYNSTDMICTGTCNNGYLFPGRSERMQMQCQTRTGYWYPYTNFPDCSRDTSGQREPYEDSSNNPEERYNETLRRCQTPPPPSNGRFTCQYNSTDMICTGICNSGYLFPGKHERMQLQCQTHRGYWFPYRSFPDCEREHVGGGTPEEENKTPEELYRETLAKCKTPNAPANGYFNCKYNSTDMVCDGTCNGGYLFHGRRQEMQLQCRTYSGYWYPYSNFPDCVREHVGGGTPEEENKTPEELYRETLAKCKTPNAPANGYSNCKYNSTDMVCDGTCNGGYLFPGRRQEMQLQCRTYSGYWYPYSNFPDCVREHVGGGTPEEENKTPEELYRETLAKCKTPNAPANGYSNCKYNSTDMVCDGTCNGGYLFPGRRQEMQLQCRTYSGYWFPHSNFPDCARDQYREDEQTGHQQQPESDDSRYRETLARCHKPDSPFPGRLSCNYDTQRMTCVGTCSQGYYFPDGTTAMTLNCLTREGVWSPVTEFSQCFSSGIHTCRDCTENEARGNVELEVTLQRCVKPTSPIPGSVQCTYDSVGMNCTGTCKNGYYFTDRTQEKVVRCLTRRGTWYPLDTFPECIRYGHSRVEDGTGSQGGEVSGTLARCQRPDSPSPGRISCSYNNEGMSCFGTCSLGYYFPGGSAEMVLNCSTVEGFWRPYSKFPPCETRDDHSCRDCHQHEDYESRDLSVTLSRCKRPFSPIPGRIHCEYDYRGMNCSGTCKEGYNFPDGTREKLTQCLTNTGTWYPLTSFPDCIEYDRRGSYHDNQGSGIQDGGLAVTLARCKPPSTPVPGRISCSYNTSTMTCTGTCSHGYTFPGGSSRMILICRTNQALWFPVDKYPQCESPAHVIYHDAQNTYQESSDNSEYLAVTLSRCKSPSSPVPGDVSCQYNSKGMNCTGTCKEGYQFKDGVKEITVRCLTVSGAWYPFEHYPECVRKEYYNRAELERMTLERQREERLLRITLNRCRRPPTPSSGYLSCGHDAIGMNCTARCSPGFSFPDDVTTKYLRCITESGSWYPERTFPECIELDYQNRHGEGQQGSLSEEELALTLLRCKSPVAPVNGNVYCRNDAIGMNCTGVCKAGYQYLNGRSEKVHRCFTVNGTWVPRHIFPSCFESRPTPGPELEVSPPERLEKSPSEKTLINCIKPEKPENGYMLCKHSPVEMNCTGWCNYRYQYDDSSYKKVLHCTGETGVWRPSNQFPKCIKTDSHSRDDLENTITDTEEEERMLQLTINRCRRPPSPSPGNVSCKYDRHGMNCTGTCNMGYEFTDGRNEITLRCGTEGGIWYPLQVFPSCIATAARNRCRKPPAPRQGHIACFNDTKEVVCSAQCFTGYQYRNGRRVMENKCSLENGIWHPFEQFPDCFREETTTGEETQQVTDTNENNKAENIEDACKDRPKPPFRGFLSCMEESTTVRCVGTCLPDYKFPRGESTVSLTCSLSTGRWSPRSSFPLCFTDRGTSEPNEDLASRPSNNNEEQTHHETDVETVLELDRKCPRPYTPKGGYIDCTNIGNLRKCTGTCGDGYAFPNGRSYFILRCSLVGTWTPRADFPDCVPKGRPNLPDDRRDLTLDRNRTGNRHDEYTGSEGEHTRTTVIENRGTSGNIQGNCRRPATPKSGYIYCVYNSNIMECTGKCGPGYRFSTGETSLIHTCDQRTNQWYPMERFPDCKPICDAPCHNGGICVRPNQCFCPQEFRGDYCQHPYSNCDPRELRFPGTIRCNHTMEETVCELGCPLGTKLDYPSYRIARCSLEGTWTPRYLPRCIEDPDALSTHSNNECGSSQCSSDITEGLCQRPATPKPGTIRCVYNKLMMECTGKCAEGYKFTDGRYENIRTCDKRTGVWSPVHNFPECKPICERGCQNGGECLAPNVCICPMRYRGDQCQYHFSNCDPHQLRFAGSIRCNHTTKETICQLGCPAGTVLDQPAYEMVRCSLEGVWSPSILPRCVEDITYERRLLEINSKSGMRFEQQYRQSEVSRTQPEGYDGQNGDNVQGREDSQLYDRQVDGDFDHRFRQNHRSYGQRPSRLEQEDLYLNRHKNDNRGTVTDERDELHRNEGRFKHYDDFLHGRGGGEGYDIHKSGEHRSSSTMKSEQTEERRHQYYRKSVSQQKTETYKEQSSKMKHQYSHYHKEQGHGAGMCSSCTP